MREAKNRERAAGKAAQRPAKSRTAKRRPGTSSGSSNAKSGTRKRATPAVSKSPARPAPAKARRSTLPTPSTSAARKKKKAPARAPAKTTAKKRAAQVSERRPTTPTPEDLLHRAMTARTPRARGIWARRGLASRRRIDVTTQSMLLRQLYMAHYEERRFAKAFEVSQQNVELGVLPDVAHQDAARAAQGLGDLDAAAGHLRLAARTGPPKRRAFHLWTLGSLYFLAGRHDDAVSVLSRAARWGTTDKPLYQGHLAMARCAGGEAVDDLPDLIQRLEGVPAGQGYGRFVLGHLAFYERRWDEARHHLAAFIARSTGGRVALAIALEGEITLARETLARMPQA